MHVHLWYIHVQPRDLSLPLLLLLKTIFVNEATSDLMNLCISELVQKRSSASSNSFSNRLRTC